MKPSSYVGIALVAALTLCLAGCFGKTPPVEEYLRIGSEGGTCESAGLAGKQTVVTVKPFKALDNLDRQAALIADGRVLVPSMRWYWEGSPESIVTAAVVSRINCLNGVGAFSPYRPRMAHDAALGGTILAFNIQRQGGARFLILMRIELWSKNFSELLATGEITAEAPIAGFEAASVAEAAAQALANASDQAAQWLEKNRKAIPARDAAEDDEEDA